ncbi:MAG: histidine--tRNA ligase [Gemmatimonadota bacterium]|nr:histidine--tRNA ligase [Gemmatimonadota bacterium]
MSPAEIQSLPGFRDFFPEDLALREHIFAAWRRVALRYGFVEYDGPPLEPLELYTRKSGEEIVGQLYDFEDKGGRAVALRPEMTPSFARMIASRAAALPKPIRWFSVPQLFRYERPQRGRLREHFQLNMDIVGETDPLADAEIIAAGIDVLRELGLDETRIVVRVSDRRLIAAVLEAGGVAPAAHGKVFAALDRLDREGPEAVRGRLSAAEIPDDAIEDVLGLGDTTLPALRERFAAAPAVVEAGDALARVLGYLEAAGLGGYAMFDASLVRGLAYYTGTVFEIWERSGELRAICGGGRYDGLLGALGGVDLPALGFGMGDVVLGELLREHDLVPSAGLEIDDFIVCVSEGEREATLMLAHALRDRGRRVAYDLRQRGVGRQFKAADQLGAARAIVVGPEELERGVAVLRDMADGEETEVGLAALAAGEESG